MQGLWTIKGLNVSKGRTKTEGVCEQGTDDINWTKERQEQEATKNYTRGCFANDILVRFQTSAAK